MNGNQNKIIIGVEEFNTTLFSIYYIGIAFPCCISVNNCICHYSPLTHDADTVLKAGDLAKIDLGAHIDGFIAVVAHTGKKQP